jgi:Ca2+/Na+ antiporter
MMLAAAVLIFPLMIHAWRLSRPNGLLLIVLYIAYGVFLANRLGYLPTHLPHWG